jgi:thioredoxin-dependent peroxiredoxin
MPNQKLVILPINDFRFNDLHLFTIDYSPLTIEHTLMITVSEGSKAPAFKGKDQNGKTVSLADYKGQKIVLYFYPEDGTPTCTVQACNLRDNFGLLKNNGFTVLGVSPDDEKKHKKFEDKYDLPFTLIADPSHAIIDKYGVWGEKQLYGRKYMGLLRTTFLIDEKGIIRKIFLKPKSKTHSEEILKAWEMINSSK